MTHHGTCTHCGQIVTIDRDYGSEEENNQHATWSCGCPAAAEATRVHQQRKRQIEGANQDIATAFIQADEGGRFNAIDPETAEIVADLLRAAVEPIADRKLYKMSIDIPGGVKATIARSGKEKITVERKDASVLKLES